MMYPRLKLLRELLSEDGSIFVQIDGNEVANLKLLLNEVFGEENYRNQITWLRSSSGKMVLIKGGYVQYSLKANSNLVINAQDIKSNIACIKQKSSH